MDLQNTLDPIPLLFPEGGQLFKEIRATLPEQSIQVLLLILIIVVIITDAMVLLMIIHTKGDRVVMVVNMQSIRGML